ncbi:hypothetical protein AUC44_15315 [Deinococcus actinosclerus]|uniref:Type II secretion system protein n=2 Tax=Deinococcus actinosclerus TaxID=1768108 RepID=A0ABN4K848_9DEIO|nr:hypothetical protein AUC44_15315 [Deinococcus actinosclerus]
MHRDGTQAFTLIEVLVALAILGIVMSTVMSALLANTSANARVNRKAEAVRISEEYMERYRQQSDYKTLQATDLENTVVRGGQTYKVMTDFCPLDLANDIKTAMPCTASSVYIRVEVSNDGKLLQRTETYYTAFGSE